MCDWVGWVGKLDKKEVETLGQLIWPGNPHATGVGLHLGDRILIRKAPLTAPEYFRKRSWGKWFYKHHRNMVGGLLHTRFATNGSPKNNLNNHPHISVDTGSVLVHQGVVRPSYLYPAISDCDSEQLLHALDHKGLIHGILDCPGKIIVAYISGNQRDRVWLYSNSTAITILRLGDRTIFSTCIEGDALSKHQWTCVSLDGEIQEGPSVPRKEISRVSMQGMWSDF